MVTHDRIAGEAPRSRTPRLDDEEQSASSQNWQGSYHLSTETSSPRKGHASQPTLVSNFDTFPDWRAESSTSRWLSQQRILTADSSSSAGDDLGPAPRGWRRKRQSTLIEPNHRMDTMSKRPRHRELAPASDPQHISPISPVRLANTAEFSGPRRLLSQSGECSDGSPAPQDGPYVSNTEGPQHHSHHRSWTAVNNPTAALACGKCEHGFDIIRECSGLVSKLGASYASGAWSKLSSQAKRDGTPHDLVAEVVELHRFLDVLEHSNQLAHRLQRFLPDALEYTVDDTAADPGRPDKLDGVSMDMKRKIPQTSDDTARRNPKYIQQGDLLSGGVPRSNSYSPFSGHHQDFHRLPPIRTESIDEHLALSSYSNRLPSMNPPPTPLRLPPSPPPPSHHRPRSPTASTNSHNFTSVPPPPSTPPTSTTSVSAPTNTSGAIPLSPAIAAHTAALQHSLSTTTFALTTLRNEHDQLLSALQRHKQRTAAIEQKANVAEKEVNELSEEKEGLETSLGMRIRELEIEVDQCRARLREEIDGRGKEKKQWVEMLRNGLWLQGKSDARWSDTQNADGPSSSTTHLPNQSTTSRAILAGEVDILRDEISHLRARCKELERVLQGVRGDNRRSEEAARAVAECNTRTLRTIDNVLGDNEPGGQQQL